MAAGGRWVGSVAEAAAAADVLVTVLPGPGEVLAVVAEVAGALRPDAVWLEMSTASPPVAEAIAATGRGRGRRAGGRRPRGCRGREPGRLRGGRRC